MGIDIRVVKYNKEREERLERLDRIVCIDLDEVLYAIYKPLAESQDSDTIDHDQDEMIGHRWHNLNCDQSLDGVHLVINWQPQLIDPERCGLFARAWETLERLVPDYGTMRSSFLRKCQRNGWAIMPG